MKLAIVPLGTLERPLYWTARARLRWFISMQSYHPCGEWTPSGGNYCIMCGKPLIRGALTVGVN